MTGSRQRRQYPVVFRDRQYRLLALILGYSLSICLVLFLCLFVPDILQMQDATADLAVRANAAERILTLHTRLWPTVLAIICLVGIHSFRMFSHVIGPFQRLRWAFEQLRNGDLTFFLTFRKGDYMIEEGEIFNQTLTVLAEHMRKVQHAVADARSLSRQLQAAAGSAPAAGAGEMADLMSRLDAQIDALDCHARFFKADRPEPEPPPAASGGGDAD